MLKITARSRVAVPSSTAAPRLRTRSRAAGRRLALAATLGTAGCGSGTGTEPPPGGTRNEPPVAAFAVDVSEGFAPLEVRFDGSGSRDPDGSVASWTWEFGDGTRGSGRVTTHVYQEPGVYTPALTVADQRGAVDRGVGEAITVNSPPGQGDAAIAGVVWHDADADGVRAEGEDVIPAMLVFLDEDDDGVRDSLEAAALTDSAGRYEFRGLDSGRSYSVTQELSLGWTNTAPGRGSSAGFARSRPPTAPIIGGGFADAGEFPFQAALLKAASRTQFCGATFIAASWVMTAAHCVDDGVEPDSVVVLAGTHDLASGGEILDVARIVVHPDFSAEQSFVNDLALLELGGRYMYPRIELLSPGVAALAAPGAVATVVGWGYTAAGGSPSTLLKKLAARIVSNDECRTQLGNHVQGVTICAGIAGAPGATCHGDSGGPLMAPYRSRWMQVGVVSFGATICNQPSAFARVSALLDFPADNVPAERSGTVVVDWAAGTAAEVDFGNFR